MPTPQPKPSPRQDGDARDGRIGLALFWIALLAVVLALTSLPATFLSKKRVSYTELERLLSEKKVRKAVVGPDEIEVELRGPTAVTTTDAAGKATVEQVVAARVPDEKLLEKLGQAGAEFEGKAGDGALAQILPTALLLGAGFLAVWLLLRRLSPQRQVAAFGKSRARLYAERETKVKFEDVAGIDEAKEELQEVVQFLRDPTPFRKLGARVPRGVLLVGPPGTGKTLLGRAVAGEADVAFFSLTGSDFVEMFAGVGAARVRDLFEQAQRQAPCIVFIDELDALGKVRGSATLSGADAEREQTLNQLLSEMDGFDSDANVVVLAATNRPEILDPALLRPGRFDRHVVVDRPDLVGREAILRVHAKKLKLGEDVDLAKVAKATPGFVGADLANVLNEAALLAGRRRKEAVAATDIQEAIERSVAGLEKKRRLISPREKERVAHHETGHALVALSVAHADPVHRVSIVPRGVAALGSTLMLPQEDRYVLTKAELEDKLAVLLGGRGAEKLVFGDTSTGAADDLARAVRLARAMVRDYGMTERFGAVAVGGEARARLVRSDEDDLFERRVSDETAREIDTEIRRIIQEAEKRVDGLLHERERGLRAIAATLLEREVIEHDELLKLAKEHGVLPA